MIELVRFDRIWAAWLVITVSGCTGAGRSGSGELDVPVFAEVVRLDTAVAPSGEGYDLFNARYVRTLGDGRLALLNAGTQEVLLFTPDGRLQSRFGGPGEGPGEFSRALFLATLPGDSILVTDLTLPQRSVVFTSDGAVARTFTLEVPESGEWYASPLGITDDRYLITAQLVVPVVPGATAGLRQIPLVLLIYDLSGRLISEVSRPPFRHEYWLVEERGAMRFLTPPYFSRSLAAGGGPGIALADEMSAKALWLAPDGALRDTVRLPEDASPLASAVVERALRSWADAAGSDEARERRRRALADLPVPATSPMVADIEFGSDGRLWIARATPTGDRDATWWVYDGNALLGSVQLPTDVEIREFGPRHVLGVQRDSLGVETVVRLELGVS